ncbi:MAG: type I-C CRISPR-associated protein Cas7/Csd2, partial [Bacillota bacterium]
FVQSDANRREGDTFRSLKDRFDANKEIQTIILKAAEEKKKTKKKQSISDDVAKIACKTWYDVRAFGQVFAFDNGENSDSVSIGVRGPVSIQSAVSVAPVDIYSQQITKSVNLETDEKDPDHKGPDTMGIKHRVEYGVYVTYGSINCQLAEKTGFSDEDADKLLVALKSLFVNDESSARPSGSMKVESVVWWKHNCKNGQYASADVHESIVIQVDQNSKKPVVIIKRSLDGLNPVIYTGENK